MLWPVLLLGLSASYPFQQESPLSPLRSSWVTLNEEALVLSQLLQRECMKRGRLLCGYSCVLFTCPESVIDGNSSRQGEQSPESSAWFYFLLRSPGQLPPPHFRTFTKRRKGGKCGQPRASLEFALWRIRVGTGRYKLSRVGDRTIAWRLPPSWDMGKGVHRPGPLALHQHSQGILSPSGSRPTPPRLGRCQPCLLLSSDIYQLRSGHRDVKSVWPGANSLH